MENLNRPIIVPWDFTQVADNAFAHAVNISNTMRKDIVLLHIVNRKGQESKALSKLKTLASKLSIDSGTRVQAVVKSGKIFDAIRETAEEMKAEMVVMGTHGRTGLQKITGSWALKVMAHSKIPFLVVQDKPKKPGFEKILFPLDFRRENKEKVTWIHYLSQYFNSKFIVFRRKVSDRGFKRRVASNLFYAESFLKNNDVSYEIYPSAGKDAYEKETIAFAKENDIDLILILITRDIGFFDYLIAAREQYIIANPEGIPVMCINPKPARISSGFSASGG